MLDFLRKELVRKFHYTTSNEDRSCSKEVVINGRSYTKHGIACAINAIALEYKVPVQGVKQFKYVINVGINVGIARQHPADILDQSLGTEVAMENALLNPVMTVTYDKKPSNESVYALLEAYISQMPITMIKTTKELKAEGADLKKYNRVPKK